jgi:hypothetical protein
MTKKLTNPTEKPDPEVKATPRRQFSAQEKLHILEEADACTEPGEIGDPKGVDRICLSLADTGLTISVDLQRVDDRHVITTSGELIVETEPVLTRRLKSDLAGLIEIFQALDQGFDPRARVGEAHHVSAGLTWFIDDHGLVVALTDINADEVLLLPPKNSVTDDVEAILHLPGLPTTL